MARVTGNACSQHTRKTQKRPLFPAGVLLHSPSDPHDRHSKSSVWKLNMKSVGLVILHFSFGFGFFYLLEATFAGGLFHEAVGKSFYRGSLVVNHLRV